MNILHKLQLLEAEMASLSPKTTLAEGCQKYNDAIVSSRRAGFLQDGALANYLCFQFCERKGDKELCRHYLEQSYSLWKMWNAHAVAESLPIRHPDFFAGILGSEENPNSSGFFRSRRVYQDSLVEQHKVLPL